VNTQNSRHSSDRLGVLIPGLGAVATTLIAGVFAVRKGLALPIGSLSEMGKIQKDKASPLVLIKDLLPLAPLENICFGGWDIFPDNAFATAEEAKVVPRELLSKLREEMEKVQPMPAVFDTRFVRRLDGPHKKRGANHWELAEAVREDIRRFKKENGCNRLVMIWCASTEVYTPLNEEHDSIAAFEDALRAGSPSISPSMIYTYAAIKEGVPYANGAPTPGVNLRALQSLAQEMSVPLAGSDFKTGQTLLKTVLAPGFKARLLGVEGWYSMNILGNRDGEVLLDPGSLKAKEVSKLGVLDSILDADAYPELYGKMEHRVNIDFYKVRGDNKESWDNIDLIGWLGQPMQIKVNLLARDSILAAPLALDLVRFLDLAARFGGKGVQDWLSFYWKQPIPPTAGQAENDLFLQKTMLEDTLRSLAHLAT